MRTLSLSISLAVGDVNGDGRPDLRTSFVSLSNLTTNLVVSLGNGDGTFQATTTFVSAFILAADLNGDGKLDMVGIGTGTVLVQLGNGAGTFQPAVKYATGNGASVVVGDVNGDGKPDLVAVADPFIRGPANQVLSGNIAVLLGNGDGTFQPAVKYPVAAGLVSVIAGDFNGDGLLDLAVSGGSGANNGITGVTILLGNGDGTFRNAMAYAAPNGPLAVGDLNADGQQDLVIADGFAGTAQVFLNTYVPGIAGSVCSPVAPFGN